MSRMMSQLKRADRVQVLDYVRATEAAAASATVAHARASEAEAEAQRLQAELSARDQLLSTLLGALSTSAPQSI